MCTPLPVKRVQIRGQRGDERLSFARLHLCNFALVQDDAADQLHVEMAHAQRAAPRLAHQGEGRHQRGCQCFLQALLVVRVVALQTFHARLHLGLQGSGLRGDLGVRELARIGLERVDFRDQRLQFFHVAFVLRADETRHDAIYDFFDVHIFRFDACEPANGAKLLFKLPLKGNTTCRCGGCEDRASPCIVL